MAQIGAMLVEPNVPWVNMDSLVSGEKQVAAWSIERFLECG